MDRSGCMRAEDGDQGAVSKSMLFSHVLTAATLCPRGGNFTLPADWVRAARKEGRFLQAHRRDSRVGETHVGCK